MYIPGVGRDAFRRVADRHVLRYQIQLRFVGHVGCGVDAERCRRCLALWRSILWKGGKNLEPDEQSEVLAAWLAGEFR